MTIVESFDRYIEHALEVSVLLSTKADDEGGRSWSVALNNRGYTLFPTLSPPQLKDGSIIIEIPTLEPEDYPFSGKVEDIYFDNIIEELEYRLEEASDQRMIDI